MLREVEMLEMIEKALHADLRVPRYGSTLDFGEKTLSITIVGTGQRFVIRATEVEK